MGNIVLQPEKESVVEDRDLGIIDIWLGVDVMKHKRLHVGSTKV